MNSEAARLISQASSPLGGLAIFAGSSFCIYSLVSRFLTWGHAVHHCSYDHHFLYWNKDDIVETACYQKIIRTVNCCNHHCIVCQYPHHRFVWYFSVLIRFLTGSVYCFPYSPLFSSMPSNLIDGVDGLAAGIGAIAAFTYGIYFYNYNEIALCILSFTLFSSLLAFLVYNFAPANIYTGDTGSLLIGLILSILTIKLIEMSLHHIPLIFHFRQARQMAIAILVLPLFDLLRVFVVRILNKRSPFHADRLHMHHLLPDGTEPQRSFHDTLFGKHWIYSHCIRLHFIGALKLLFVISTLVPVVEFMPFYLKYQAEKARLQ
ncbi:MAG: MraY family glycosyltransferase [Bacteroidia bacterium]